MRHLGEWLQEVRSAGRWLGRFSLVLHSPSWYPTIFISQLWQICFCSLLDTQGALSIQFSRLHLFPFFILGYKQSPLNLLPNVVCTRFRFIGQTTNSNQRLGPCYYLTDGLDSKSRAVSIHCVTLLANYQLCDLGWIHKQLCASVFSPVKMEIIITYLTEYFEDSL